MLLIMSVVQVTVRTSWAKAMTGRAYSREASYCRSITGWARTTSLSVRASKASRSATTGSR